MKAQEDFSLFCADLSLNRPGFAELRYHADTRSVEVVRKSIVDNKGIRNGNKPHGQKLAEIAAEMRSYMENENNTTYVREKWVYVKPTDAYALAKVHGISDIYAWKHGRKEFYEVNPISIKKLIAGDGRAKKDAVASGLAKYVGEQEYKTDDESDAVAVGVAWLIQNKYIDKLEEPQDERPEENQ